MTHEELQARIARDTSEGGRFRVLPVRVPLDDTHQETRVDDDVDHEDRRHWAAVVLYALDD